MHELQPVIIQSSMYISMGVVRVPSQNVGRCSWLHLVSISDPCRIQVRVEENFRALGRYTVLVMKQCYTLNP